MSLSSGSQVKGNYCALTTPEAVSSETPEPPLTTVSAGSLAGKVNGSRLHRHMGRKPAAHCLHLPTLGVYTVNVISEKEENLLVPEKRQS